MPTFVVQLPGNDWDAPRAIEVTQASASEIEQGALVFSNEDGDIVAAFAQGSWGNVHRLPDPPAVDATDPY